MTIDERLKLQRFWATLVTPLGAKTSAVAVTGTVLPLPPLEDESEPDEGSRAWEAQREERRRQRRAEQRPIQTRRAVSKKFGVPEDEAARLLALALGACTICREAPPAGKRHGIDHCHRTGAVRAVLCHRCNMLVAYLENNESLVDTAWAYIRTHREAKTA